MKRSLFAVLPRRQDESLPLAVTIIGLSAADLSMGIHPLGVRGRKAVFPSLPGVPRRREEALRNL